MKKIGIVGGVGWLSTVDYYSEICRRSERWHVANNLPGPPSMPEMAIESLDLSTAISYLGMDDDEESWLLFDEYHRAALKRLEASGADFALIASNTAHHRFEAIASGVGIPVLSILDLVAKESARLGAKQVLILGTALTMSSQRFRDEFAKYGIDAAGPDDEMTRSLTSRLIADLQLGKLEGAPDRLASIAKASFQQQFDGQPVVCLACTELPSAFPRLRMLPAFELDGVVYIDTTIVHVNAAFDFALTQ